MKNNMQDILKNFPPASQNNSRQIIRGMIERIIEKPSYGLQKKLESMGIGVEYTTSLGEDGTEVEDVFIFDRELVEEMSDDELSEALKY